MGTDTDYLGQILVEAAGVEVTAFHGRDWSLLGWEVDEDEEEEEEPGSARRAALGCEQLLS